MKKVEHNQAEIATLIGAKKLDELRKQGGHTSSVEREVKTFQRQLEAPGDLLGK